MEKLWGVTLDDKGVFKMYNRAGRVSKYSNNHESKWKIVRLSVSPEIVDPDLIYLYTFTASHNLKVELKLQFEYELCDVYWNTICRLKTGSKQTS